MLLVVVLVGRLDTVKMMLTCRADKSKFDAGSRLSMVFHIMDTEIVVAVSVFPWPPARPTGQALAVFMGASKRSLNRYKKRNGDRRRRWWLGRAPA